jgi:hypothetical protein
VPEGVTKIGVSAFQGCEALAEVTLPDSLTAICTLAFADCPALTRLELPDHITTLPASAFRGCENLTLAVTYGSETHEACKAAGLTVTYLEPEDPLSWLHD